MSVNERVDDRTAPAPRSVHVGLYIRSVSSGRGAERSIVNVCRGLAARGHRVDLVLEREEGWLLHQVRGKPNIRIVPLPAGSRISMHDRAAAILTAARCLVSRPRGWRGLALAAGYAVAHRLPVHMLRTYVETSRPEVLFTFLNKANVTLLLAAASGRLPTHPVVTFHNNLSAAAELGTSRRMLQILPALLDRAERVVAVSEGVRDDLVAISGIDPRCCSVLYNPVFDDTILELAAAPVEHPWFEDHSAPVVVAAGKLSAQKDYPTLLKAFAKVRASRPARLLVLGEGELLAPLQRLCDELGITRDVEFAGYVRNPYAFFRRADLFVMSSLHEGMPTALIEAMACGCPVVSTDCPSGPSEILAGGRFGALVPVGDSTLLGEAMLKALASPPPPQPSVERARCFSFESAIREYETLTLELASRARSASSGTPGLDKPLAAS